MRALLLSSFALAAVAACNPYDPNLPSTPFRCGEEAACPGGYECAGGFCVEEGGEAPVDGQGPDSRNGACEDPAEPNDDAGTATPGAVFDVMPVITFEGLTLCPTMDTDLFKLNQQMNCGGETQPACPNLDVEVVWEDLANAPTLAVLNQNMALVTNGVPDGSGKLHASANNMPQGGYFVRVTSQAVIPHYRLTIDGRRTE